MNNKYLSYKILYNNKINFNFINKGIEFNIKKNFLFNFIYFFYKEMPTKLTDKEILKYKKYNNIYILFTPIPRRDKIPINEFNYWASFFNINTKKWLENAYFEGIQKINTIKWKPFIYFFKLLYNKFNRDILDYILIDGSFTVMLNGIRISKDIDIAVVYPKTEKRNKLDEFILKQEKTIKGTSLDIYLKDKKLWNNNTPNILNKNSQRKGIKNYNTQVKSDKYSFLFFGIKIINLELYINDMAHRRYPKNVFDTIQTRRLIGITMPIKPLEENIQVNNNIYTKKKFLNSVINKYKQYLNKKINLKQLNLYMRPHLELYNKIIKNTN